MKKFFTILDKNFTNLIFMFILMLVEAWVLGKYNMTFLDMIISSVCIGIYLRICDEIALSFKKFKEKKGDKNVD